LHRAIVRHLANRRAGTADTKRRDEVAGGGRKPWRQKGTGRARHGSIRSPIWRKGGVVFGPHPRSYGIALPKRARRKALAMALAAKASAGELTVLQASDFAPAKTKEFVAFLDALDKGSNGEAPDTRARVLVVIDPARDGGAFAIARAARNVASATVVARGDVSVHALLAHGRVLLTQHAFDALAEVCGG
jgi:large subunit ribosomal protein L4